MSISAREETTTAEQVEGLLAALSLEERVRLLTGATTWKLYELPAIGLRAMAMSDGPIGVRGVTEERLSSAQLPAPSAVAATWDENLVGGLGAVMADEARAKGADVVLAPAVNLQRSPVGGRNFEFYSEDPLLSGRIAAAFVTSIQANGIGACIKHFLGNETETERTEYIARLDPRTLREVYLAPFEPVVREAGVWTLMAAYNAVDDGVETAPATEHVRLLNDVLKGEWGFDGVVVSDWTATKTTVRSALGGLDLVMPGPGGPWGDALLDAVRRGDVPQDAIDDKVRRLLLLAVRVGALDGIPLATPRASGHDPATMSTLRAAAARSTVVLRNKNALLPLPASTGRIALLGANAVEPFVQGGGSAHVDAPHLSLPLDEVQRAFPGAIVTAHRGGATLRHLPYADNLVEGTEIGLEILDDAGRILQRRTESAPWHGRVAGLPAAADTVRVTATLRLEVPGDHVIEIASVGRHRIEVDGELISVSDQVVGQDAILDSSANHPEGVLKTVTVDAPRDVRIDATVQVVTPGLFDRFASAELRYQGPGPTADEEIEQAVAAARAADVAVVVVGTNSETESEGWDRPDLELPGRQHELVRRVAAANPRTVVVVNAGAPVLLPWLDEVDAVLWWWLPGQEAGGSLADVLSGAVEPSGRLPWTLPARAADVPVPDGVPVDGVIDYAEGLDVGHRGWDRAGRTPAREFGFGLGYSTWHYGAPTVAPWYEGQPTTVTVPLHNNGTHDSREVVQVYLETSAGPLRPVRWLAGFATADVAAGARTTVDVQLAPRAFEVWDEPTHTWQTPSGEYRVHIGRSSRDLRCAVSLTVPGRG
ncbi:MAG: beta-glucosidase [Amycolatopsis sp.]|uniref:beta-glucosidase n=1 Tax=Amycolatopsis sp. TaxID=37632 RepID=UPI002610229C|nr:glycoside hydrolase family 3 C-terminal domain-containing protein [Amycolatopsis sp.]MCU1680294.1 beta-glucosidase [Amycolatopsis sp.]